jgi:hypothetical protein
VSQKRLRALQLARKVTKLLEDCSELTERLKRGIKRVMRLSCIGRLRANLFASKSLRRLLGREQLNQKSRSWQMRELETQSVLFSLESNPVG